MAKEITCPTTAAELSKVVDAELKYHNQKLCHILRKAMKEWAGDANLRVVGPKQFGADNFKTIYYDNKLPCLKNLIKLADKLNLRLVWRNYPFAFARAVPGRDLTFGAEYDHDELIAFLEELRTLRAFRGDSREMQKEREVILKKLSNPAFPIYWTTLIRYAAACGYQLNCYLNPKPKLDGCLTPSQKDWNLTDAGKEEYEALIRRLNYPA